MIQIPGGGMIFPDGTDKDSWGWSVAKEVEIPEEDQKKYPIPDKEGEYYASMLDMDNLRKFSKDEFEAACEILGLIKDI